MPVRRELPQNAPPPASRIDGARPLQLNRVLVVAGVIAALLIAIVVFAVSQREAAGGIRKATDKQGSATSVQTLPRGTVTYGEGGAEELFGIPIKYPHTVAGGTSAALNAGLMGSGPVSVSESSREELNGYLYTKKGAESFAVSSAEAARLRAAANVDEELQVLRDDGTVDAAGVYLTSTVIAEYGAYRVMPGATKDRQTVEFWGPLVSGVVRGDPAKSDIEILWVQMSIRVVWDRGDWRVDGGTVVKGAPDPANRAALNVSFAERAALLPRSDGWVMVTNATQTTEAYPDGLRKP